MSSTMEKAEEMNSEVTKRLERTPLKWLSTKTGIDMKYISLGIVALVSGFLMFGLFGSLITSIVGFFYPVLMSFSAIDSEEKNDDKLWLTYWSVYGLICVAENFIEWILAFVPFYYPIKMAFLIWMFLPQTQGSVWLYDHFVDPVFNNYETEIDEFVGAFGSILVESYTEIKEATLGKFQSLAPSLMAKLAGFMSKQKTKED
mmetsp:Transcript_61580/g.70607  ORF Transcript_61580/g.70607 Transcript_61580/m.70607 type:complete len:202 (-) Transcript_61580:293-898(-)